MNQDCIREEIKTTLNLGNVTARSCIFCLPDCFQKNMAIHRYKNVILPVVLCRCQTWSLTLREEQGIRLFRNRMLNEILGLKWRNVKSHIELYDLYSLLNIIEEIKSRSLRQANHMACGREGNAYNILVWKRKVSRMLGKHRQENNIKLYLRNRWVWTTWFCIGSVFGCDPVGSII